MKLYFVRHGESEANVAMEFSNSAARHPLTANGVAQAQAVAQSLVGLNVHRVYSSPILRAAQTAQIIAGRMQAPVEYSKALREWSVGDYEGTRDPAGWALHRQVQEDWFWRGQLDSKMPGGESFLEIKARFIPWIAELLSQAGDENETIILVAHGGLYLAMLPLVLQNIEQDFALQHLFPYTGCVIAETRENGLWCQSWCGIRV